MRDTTVQHEVELKFEADPDDFDRLLRHPALQDAIEGPGLQSLRSIYFDTHDHALHDAGISLRIRTDGRRRIQTIKAPPKANGIALERMEWETPVRSDKPDLTFLSGPGLEPLLNLKNDIKPILSIDVHRTTITVRHEGSIVEVAFDRGSVRGHAEARPFAEIELELKRGDLEDLFGLARALADTAPLRLSFLAKSDRGFGALGEAPTRAKAEPIELKRRTTSGEAFQAIASSCLRHLMANYPILREHRAPEAVHQMRVALRRLRAAIALFKAVVADEQRDRVRNELKWMASQLGEARDLDVYIAQTLEPARARHGDVSEFQTLMARYEERRRSAYDTVQETIASPRFLKGVLDTAAWIQTGEWLSLGGEVARARENPALDHAKDELSRRWSRVRKRGKKLTAFDPEERHQLRIEIKKLRYAIDFFQSLFKGSLVRKPKKAAREVLEALQDTLGELNDIAVRTDIGDLPASEMVRQEQLERVEPLLAAAEVQYRSFASLERFWRAK